MRLGLNGTAYDALSSGARERFLNLYGELARRLQDSRCFLYSPRDVALGPLFDGPAAEDIRSPFSADRPLHRFLLSRGWFGRRAARDRLDLFVTDHFPVVGDRTLLTIHDLRYLTLPDAGTKLRRAWFRSRFAKTARRARAVVTVSETMREEVLDRLGLDPGRVHCVPNGVSGRLGASSAENAARFRERRGWPSEYLLAIGVFERRKNLPILLDALSMLPRSDAPVLVLAGRGGPEEDRLRVRVAELGLDDRVHFAGYVAEDELAAAYTGAAALVMPSRYEGFGLPVIQAFACGTPVIAADASALPEVAGGAARLCDPDDADAWREAIRTVLGDSTERERLTADGRARAAKLTWSHAAHRMVGVLRSVVE